VFDDHEWPMSDWSWNMRRTVLLLAILVLGPVVSACDGYAAGSFTKAGIALPVDLANAIAANPGAFCANIHTAANPGGVARGQLARVQ
jgi:hypothetical protein